MARAQSPGYPNMSLQKAIVAAKKIFDADRRNPIDREVAAKHIGYSGISGASDKSLASLSHYGLIEKTGKAEIRISQLAVDIFHPASPADRSNAIFTAGTKPQIFKDLLDRFPGGQVSESALKSYLIRENFLDRAIGPVAQAFFDNCRFLEQEKAVERPIQGSEASSEDDPRDDKNAIFGGAKVGDSVQWEVDGILQMEKPMRVRLVSDDGEWIAVDGSETGIPMRQVIVEDSAPPAVVAPRFALNSADPPTVKVEPGEMEWMRSLVGQEIKIRILVSGGEIRPKEIGRLIKLLEVQKQVLSDLDDED